MSKLKEHTSDNKLCIQVDNIDGLQFMSVYKPEHVSIFVDKTTGNVCVNVNDSCVFAIKTAKVLDTNI